MRAVSNYRLFTQSSNEHKENVLLVLIQRT